ncbi:collagen-like triple helix repeat-containing protein, partial [Bordetella pertussis]|uniref:collagen-like triple helix repeat-containing protein n=1 Tax=Bordetella pertussis TaxID=520 RepID=UPI0018A773DE
GPGNPGGPGGPGTPGNPDPTTPVDPVRAGLLETTLGNTGGATDSLLPLGADNALGAVGKALDPTLKPVVDTTVGLTQQIGATTGLGAPVDGVLTQVGGTVSGLGDTVAGTGLPGGLSTGLGGLVDGLGKTVASTGGLLHADANNPEPLTAVLGNATGAVGAVLDGPTQPILQPALTNTGTAADNVASLGL